MKTFKLFISFICIVSLASCGTKNTPLPECQMSDSWITFNEDSDKVCKIYSDVTIDSNIFISSILIEYKRNNNAFTIEKCKWLVDAKLNKIQECGNIFYDSLNKVVYSNNSILDENNWQYVTPGTNGAGAARLTKLLYDNKNNLPRCTEPIEVHWGDGEWHKYKEKEHTISYLNVEGKNDSCYIVWYYYCFKDLSENFWSEKDNSGVERILYAAVSKRELMINENKGRILEGYSIDKYNDLFFDDSANIDHEWTEVDDDYIKAVKESAEKNHIK